VYLLKDISGKYCRGSVWGQVVGASEYGNEPSIFIKCGEFLD
jgi:hypothetical protein